MKKGHQQYFHDRPFFSRRSVLDMPLSAPLSNLIGTSGTRVIIPPFSMICKRCRELRRGLSALPWESQFEIFVRSWPLQDSVATHKRSSSRHTLRVKAAILDLPDERSITAHARLKQDWRDLKFGMRETRCEYRDTSFKSRISYLVFRDSYPVSRIPFYDKYSNKNSSHGTQRMPFIFRRSLPR